MLGRHVAGVGRLAGVLPIVVHVAGAALEGDPVCMTVPDSAPVCTSFMQSAWHMHRKIGAKPADAKAAEARHVRERDTVSLGAMFAQLPGSLAPRGATTSKDRSGDIGPVGHQHELSPNSELSHFAEVGIQTTAVTVAPATPTAQKARTSSAVFFRRMQHAVFAQMHGLQHRMALQPGLLAGIILILVAMCCMCCASAMAMIDWSKEAPPPPTPPPESKEEPAPTSHSLSLSSFMPDFKPKPPPEIPKTWSKTPHVEQHPETLKRIARENSHALCPWLVVGPNAECILVVPRSGTISKDAYVDIKDSRDMPCLRIKMDHPPPDKKECTATYLVIERGKEEAGGAPASPRTDGGLIRKPLRSMSVVNSVVARAKIDGSPPTMTIQRGYSENPDDCFASITAGEVGGYVLETYDGDDTKRAVTSSFLGLGTNDTKRATRHHFRGKFTHKASDKETAVQIQDDNHRLVAVTQHIASLRQDNTTDGTVRQLRIASASDGGLFAICLIGIDLMESELVERKKRVPKSGADISEPPSTRALAARQDDALLHIRSGVKT